MKREQTALQKYCRDKRSDQWSIFFAAQVIAASIFYLIFFVWN